MISHSVDCRKQTFGYRYHGMALPRWYTDSWHTTCDETCTDPSGHPAPRWATDPTWSQWGPADDVHKEDDYLPTLRVSSRGVYALWEHALLDVRNVHLRDGRTVTVNHYGPGTPVDITFPSAVMARQFLDAITESLAEGGIVLLVE